MNPILQNLSRRTVLLRLLGVAAYYAVFAAGLIGYNSRHGVDFSAILQSGSRIVIGILLILVPLLFFHIFEMIFDKPWEGVVTEHSNDRRFTMSALHRRMREATVETIYVQCDDGKRRCFEFWDDKIKYAGYFAVGDRVRHYRTVPFPEKVDKTADTLRFCCRCGTAHHPETDKCCFCHTRLPSAELDSAERKKKSSSEFCSR